MSVLVSWDKEVTLNVYLLHKFCWEYPMQEKCSESPIAHQYYKEFPWFLPVPFASDRKEEVFLWKSRISELKEELKVVRSCSALIVGWLWLTLFNCTNAFQRLGIRKLQEMQKEPGQLEQDLQCCQGSCSCLQEAMFGKGNPR